MIGTGGVARMHARHFNAHKEVDLVACCDLDETKAKAFAETWSIAAAYGSADEMLATEALDAITVCTPDKAHAAMSILALKAGKHTLCEKPLATSHADALKMVEAARESGKINMVNFSKRSKPAVHYAAALVASGKLGRIYHAEGEYLQSWLSTHAWGDWREKPNMLWRLSTRHGSTGVLGDLGVHILDFVTYPVGTVKRVSCQLTNYAEKVPGNRIDDYDLDADDTAIITLTFANGATGSVRTTRCATSHPDMFTLTIYGELGAVRYRSSIHNEPSPVDGDIGETVEVLWVDPDTRQEGTWERLTLDPVPWVFERFITSIQSGKQEQPDFARGAEMQAVLDACRRSSDTGTFIDL